MPHAILETSEPVIAKAVTTRIVAFFDAAQRAALEAQLRSEHKSGSLTLDFSNGTLCGMRWEEGPRR